MRKGIHFFVKEKNYGVASTNNLSECKQIVNKVGRKIYFNVNMLNA